MADSEGRTGQKIIQEINRETLMACILPKDIHQAVNQLIKIINKGETRDQIQAIKILLEHSIGKPRQINEFQEPQEIKIVVTSSNLEDSTGISNT